MIFLVCVGGDLLYCCHFSHGDFQWSCSTKQHLPFASSALTAGLLEYKFAVFSHWVKDTHFWGTNLLFWHEICEQTVLQFLVSLRGDADISGNDTLFKQIFNLDLLMFVSGCGKHSVLRFELMKTYDKRGDGPSTCSLQFSFLSSLKFNSEFFISQTVLGYAIVTNNAQISAASKSKVHSQVDGVCPIWNVGSYHSEGKETWWIITASYGIWPGNNITFTHISLASQWKANQGKSNGHA